MALSLAYIPSINRTYAIFYGCDSATEREVEGRLRISEETLYHPLILPGIFAEVERRRHFELVQRSLNQQVQFVSNLLNNANSGGGELTAQDSVDLWLRTRHIHNGLQNWVQQLRRMIAHANELSTTLFREEPVGFNGGVETVRAPAPVVLDTQVRESMRRAGTRIRERLVEIVEEYEEKIRECDMIMAGMTMAAQLVRILDCEPRAGLITP